MIVERDAALDTEPSAFRVTLINPARDTVFSTSLAYQPIAMPDAAVRRATENVQVVPRDHENQPSASQIAQTLRNEGLIPETLTPVTELAVGQDGSTWLRREDAGDSVLWNVLGPDGRPLGALRLPRSQTVMAASGDVMAAVELDEFDVPYVLRYRIRH